MSGTEILLDTNALIALTRDEAGVLEVVAPFEVVSLTVFTLGELQYGVSKSARPEDNRRRLAVMLESFRLVMPDQTSAVVYGDLFHQLKRKGRPIPTNDVWIAALALQHSLPLLTRDRHFREVEGVDVRGW
jgi:tRNA(fMet)-specific endonuclease VapC